MLDNTTIGKTETLADLSFYSKLHQRNYTHVIKKNLDDRAIRFWKNKNKTYSAPLTPETHPLWVTLQEVNCELSHDNEPISEATLLRIMSHNHHRGWAFVNVLAFYIIVFIINIFFDNHNCFRIIWANSKKCKFSKLLWTPSVLVCTLLQHTALVHLHLASLHVHMILNTAGSLCYHTRTVWFRCVTHINTLFVLT